MDRPADDVPQERAGDEIEERLYEALREIVDAPIGGSGAQESGAHEDGRGE